MKKSSSVLKKLIPNSKKNYNDKAFDSFFLAFCLKLCHSKFYPDKKDLKVCSFCTNAKQIIFG